MAQLDAQPVHQPRQVTVAARLLDQALLRRSKRLRPVGCKRERVETEARIEPCHLVGEKPLKMRRFAAGDCSGDTRNPDAAVDPKAGEAEAAGAQPPVLELHDKLRHQPLERLACRFRICRRLFQPKNGSRRRLVASGGQRLGLSAERTVERIDDIVRAPEPPRQCQPRQAGKRSDHLQPKPLESPHRVGLKPERRHVKLRKLCVELMPSAQAGGVARQCPGRSRSRSDRQPRRQARTRKTPAHILGQRLLAAEQMRNSADIEPERIAAVHLDQRRPSESPARKPPEQRLVSFRIGRDGDQAGVERPGVGQPRAAPGAALRRRFRDRVDGRAVSPLDRQDDGSVRR